MFLRPHRPNLFALVSLLSVVSIASCVDLDALGDGTRGAETDGATPADAAPLDTSAPDGPVPADCPNLGSRDSCGACGRSCVESDCVDNLCVPRTLFATTSRVQWLRTFDESLYFTTASGVHSCPKSGCPDAGPSTLLTGAAAYGGVAVESTGLTAVVITGFAQNTTTGDVVRCPLAGACSAPTVVAANQEGPNALDVGEGVAFWGRSTFFGGQGEVAACPTSGCDGGEPRVAAALTNQVVTVLARDALYAASPDRIVRAPLDGGPTTVLAGAGNGAIADLTLADGALFWANTENSSVETCPGMSSCSSERRFLVTGIGQPRALVGDGSFVFIAADGPSGDAGSGGRILRCATTTCPSPLVIAKTASTPVAIAVDSTFVYWTESNGTQATIARVAR